MFTWQESRQLFLDYRGSFTVSGDKVYIEKVDIEAPLWKFPLYDQMELNADIWLVFGPAIRAFLSEDWHEGGHHYIFPWIRPGEIWIESNSYKEELPVIYMKYAISRFLMRDRGLTFLESEAISNAYATDHKIEEYRTGRMTLKSFYPKKNTLVIEYKPPVVEKLVRGKKLKNVELEELRRAQESLLAKRDKLKDKGWDEIFEKLREVEEDLRRLPS